MDNMAGLKRSVYCGELRSSNVGEEVTVCGWVAKQRDLGSLIFIDLRDRTGIVQLAFDDNTDREIFEKAFGARSEYVLMAKGVVRERSSKNSEIPTGDVEIDVKDLRVLSKSETPPFDIVENCQTAELTRLKYRYLDLRRPDLQQNILFRHKVTKITRDYFDENGFVEIETPMLIKSTPEGARVFHSHLSFTSSFQWWQASTDICRLPVASVMKTFEQTVSPNLHKLTLKCLSLQWRMFFQ